VIIKAVFSLVTLDQGIWPEGLHTQPGDAALKFGLVESAG
jgi:hypothetical protein